MCSGCNPSPCLCIQPVVMMDSSVVMLARQKVRVLPGLCVTKTVLARLYTCIGNAAAHDSVYERGQRCLQRSSSARS